MVESKITHVRICRHRTVTIVIGPLAEVHRWNHSTATWHSRITENSQQTRQSISKKTINILHTEQNYISWSGSTIGYTCTVSMMSVLSQMMRESLAFFNSASCSGVNEDGWLGNSYLSRSSIIRICRF